MKTLSSPIRHWLHQNTGLGIQLRRARTWWRKHRDHNRVANIAMLHTGRCGSTVVSDLLNQHPDIRWHGEPFENMSPAYYNMNSKQRARQVITDSMHCTESPIYGFDSKYLPEQHLRPELANLKISEYLDLLQDLGFSHFIILNRNNYLRQAISTAIGNATAQWYAKRGEKIKSSCIRLEPDHFISYGKEMSLLDYFNHLKYHENELENAINGRKYISLSFEDDVETNPVVAYRKICHFLSIPAGEVEVRLQKMNTRPLRDLVENFEAIKKYLSDTPYAWMLKENAL